MFGKFKGYVVLLLVMLFVVSTAAVSFAAPGEAQTADSCIYPVSLQIPAPSKADICSLERQMSETAGPQPPAGSGYAFMYVDDPVSSGLPAGTVWIGDYTGTLPEILPIPDGVGFIGSPDKYEENIRLFPGFGNGDGMREGSLTVREVRLPDSGVSLGAYAFAGCTNLESINLENAAELQAGVFDSCTSLKSVILPEPGSRNHVIPLYLFRNCASLENVSIPYGYEAIGQSAFELCTNLKEITLPESISDIVYGAFAGCSDLKEITYEGTVKQWEAMKIEPGTIETGTRVVCSDGIIEDAGPEMPYPKPGSGLESYYDSRVNGSMLSGLTVGESSATVGYIMENYTLVPGSALTVVSADGEPCTADMTAATGQHLILTGQDGKTEDITVVVKGDVLGTGSLNISQLVRMARALNGAEPLTGAYLAAGVFRPAPDLSISDLVAEAQLLTGK